MMTYNWFWFFFVFLIMAKTMVEAWILKVIFPFVAKYIVYIPFCRRIHRYSMWSKSPSFDANILLALIHPFPTKCIWHPYKGKLKLWNNISKKTSILKIYMIDIISILDNLLSMYIRGVTSTWGMMHVVLILSHLTSNNDVSTILTSYC